MFGYRLRRLAMRALLVWLLFAVVCRTANALPL